MNNKYKELSHAFIEHEKIRGIKSLHNLTALLNPFFTYLSIIGKTICEIGDKESQEFQTYLSTLKKEDGRFHYTSLSVSKIMSTALQFYNFLRETGKVCNNPFLRIKRIRLERKLPRDIPAEKKMAKILKILKEFWKKRKVTEKRMYYKSHVMAELMYATGMRIGEVLSLKKEDVDYTQKVIHIKYGKGGKKRYAYLNEYAARVLEIYINQMGKLVNKNKSSDRVFGVKDRSTITPTYHRVLNEAAVECGIKRFPSHTFRHTLGYHLLKRGCDMRYIQLILGHEDIKLVLGHLMLKL